MVGQSDLVKTGINRLSNSEWWKAKTSKKMTLQLEVRPWLRHNYTAIIVHPHLNLSYVMYDILWIRPCDRHLPFRSKISALKHTSISLPPKKGCPKTFISFTYHWMNLMGRVFSAYAIYVFMNQAY